MDVAVDAESESGNDGESCACQWRHETFHAGFSVRADASRPDNGKCRAARDYATCKEYWRRIADAREERRVGGVIERNGGDPFVCTLLFQAFRRMFKAPLQEPIGHEFGEVGSAKFLAGGLPGTLGVREGLQPTLALAGMESRECANGSDEQKI